MSFYNINSKLDQALQATLQKAKKAYEGKQDETAAAAFDRASEILLQLAENQPTRDLEIEKKKKAFKYREFSKRLRSGSIPASRSGPGKDAGPAGQVEKAGGEGGDFSHVVKQLVHRSKISWEQIGGLEDTKREIKFALGLSVAQPPPGVEVAAWRNILFYGPPGTGKTLLAAATSNALKMDSGRTALFFNVKVSSVLSKYFGESSKIVSEIYGTARDESPSVVFLDEFESLGMSRDEENSGPERRILSTILAELDGLSEKGRRDIYVLTIAATNRPWDLDAAVLSRFEKRILIPLPDAFSRRAILEIHLLKKGFQLSCGLDDLVGMTEGYSGRELERFAKQTTIRMIAEANAGIPGLVDAGYAEVRRHQIQVRALSLADFEQSRRSIAPQTSEQDMQRYRDWQERQEA